LGSKSGVQSRVCVSFWAYKVGSFQINWTSGAGPLCTVPAEERH